MPTPRQLEVFLAAAQLGSVSEAARSLGISQPGASKQIKSLERQLGGRLFERRQGTVSELSQLGRSMIAPAQEMVEMQLHMESLRAPPLEAERVTIFVRPFLFSWIGGSLDEAFPRPGPVLPELRALDDDVESLLDAIRGERSAFGLLHDIHLPLDASFDFTILRVQPCGLYVSAHHPAAREGALEDVNAFDWIVPNGPDRLTNWLRQMLVVSGVSRDRIVTGTPSATSNLGQVLSGAGGGIFMDNHVRDAAPAGELVRLPQPIAPIYSLLVSNRTCDPRVQRELAERLGKLDRSRP